MTAEFADDRVGDIAVIGMQGRFPGAADVAEFWKNLRDGVESIRFLSDEQLLAAGTPPELLRDPNFVRASGVLDGVELFDAAFFGYSPREAEVLDPQHRLFLECAWAALEAAGYNPHAISGRVGVFAGAGLNCYWLHNLKSRPEVARSVGDFAISLGNDKDFVPTRVSYKLNLTGPSLNINTACSTSLVAVHVACQNLLMFQCDMALAGGVGVHLPQDQGYVYQEGMVMSPDGHCRAFDAAGRGTVGGNGVGVVVLKRLDDAIADRDQILAVIKGSAVNNDGANKIGFTAPGLDGQADVIAEAQSLASVDPETITYIEAHGTGTSLGDPLEIAALTKAFRRSTQKKGYCAIGTVKTNIGHLDTAAGVAGLIKTVLSLQHAQLPPSLHFEQPNQAIDFANSPFFVNTKLTEWKTNGVPRRAGVSSFGIGGTNAHVVVEEAPPSSHHADRDGDTDRHAQLLVISARSDAALDRATANLAEYFVSQPNCHLADAAYTLATGRKAFRHRSIVVGRSPTDVAESLRTGNAAMVHRRVCSSEPPPVVWMFSGQGSQYVDMGRGLYDSEPVFREHVDRCSEILRSHLACDMREVLFSRGESADVERRSDLHQTAFTQPALFVVEYALARLWESWGVRPSAMIGHSVGEYVAATIAGVFSLPDALALVAARGRLIQQLAPGAMLAVPLGEDDLREKLRGTNLDVATINGPSQCVVAGPLDEIAAFQRQLGDRDVAARVIPTSHAFHSRMMDPVLPAFRDLLKRLHLATPQLPWVSNVTGTWIRDADAMDPEYWVRHLRSPVRFADGLRSLFAQPGQVLLEVGPGRTLAMLAKRHPDRGDRPVFTSLRHPQDEQVSDSEFVLLTLGQLWTAGVDVAWSDFYAGQSRYRVALPTYPFERQRHWIEARQGIDDGRAEEKRRAEEEHSAGKRPDMADWFYVPTWKRDPLPHRTTAPLLGPVLVFADDGGLAEALVERLRTEGIPVVVGAGDAFEQHDDSRFTIRPGEPADYVSLFETLRAADRLPRHIVHLFLADRLDDGRDFAEQAATLDRGFYSLLFLAQALGQQNIATSCRLLVVSAGLHDLAGETSISPPKAAVLGPVTVIPQEFPNIECRSMDVVIRATPRPDGRSFSHEAGASGRTRYDDTVRQILDELGGDSGDQVVAYRGVHRWSRTFEPAPLAPTNAARLRERGVYLITGGLGGIGLVLAEHLAKSVSARLVLISRSLPPEGSDAKRRLDQLATYADVLVIPADVTDATQMQAALATAREKFGAIHGVIHAAGVPGEGVMQLKTRDRAARTLAPKIMGTLVLDQLLATTELDWFVLCSSLTSVLGGFGQVDYCGANAFLDAYAQDKSARGTPTIAINWDAWSDVGMAWKALTPTRMPVPHPLLREVVAGHEPQFLAKLDVAEHWPLNEHRVLGQPTLPATAYLEMARAAFQQHTGSDLLELRDVFLLQPLSVSESATVDVRTALTKRGDEWQFSITSLHGANEWREHARGSIRELAELAPGRELRVLVPDASATTGRVDQTSPSRPGRAPEAHDGVVAGPRWQNLAWGQRSADEGFVCLELPAEFAADIATYRLHPALVDVATNYLAAADNELFLPFSYRSLRILGPLPAKVYSHIRRSGTSPDSRTFDVTISDESGRVLVELAGYDLRRVPPGDGETAGVNGQVTERHERSGAVTIPVMAPGGVRGSANALADALANGLTSSEGVEVFSRILAHAPPQILVSTQDLARLLEQSRKPGPLPERTGPVRDEAKSRRTLTIPYRAPRNDREEQLARIWQEFLRIEQVGIEDDFFELGGDSLLAVQLASQLSEQTGANVSPNLLLSSPTIARLAEVVGAPARSQMLVPIHAGRADRRPLFLIHPVGGSVYGYRELGRNLGSDQSVWAIQSRGLDGEAPPLESVDEMARHYLSLVRGVQPHGPYQLGGWSQGGLVAFEMAQQLARQNEAVSLLAMIDSFAPGDMQDLDEPELAAYFADYVGAVVGRPLTVRVDELQPLNSRNQLRLILQKAQAAGALPPDLNENQIRSRFDVFKANFRAMDRYRPQRYAGPVTLIAAHESARVRRDATLGWRPLFDGDLTSHTIPGNHYTIIGSQPLFEILRDRLRAAPAMIAESETFVDSFPLDAPAPR